jgi:hypothetical protein
MGELPDEPEAGAPVPKPDPTPPKEGSGAIVPAREVDREQFIDTFTVREKGRRYEVAANAIANKAMMQVNVAKLRVLHERAMKPYFDNPELPIGPKELKVLTESAEVIERMAEAAYSNSKQGNMANALEKLVFAAAKGAAAGSIPGSSGDHPLNRMSRMQALIGRAKPVVQEAEVVDG